MKMNLSRWTLVLLLAVQATIGAALLSEYFHKWLAWLSLAAVFVGSIVLSLTQPVTAASADKTPPAVPPAIGGLLLVVLTLAGCSWLGSPQGAQGAGLAAKDVVCVISHDSEPVSQIIADCNLVADAAQIVEQILAQAHANEARAARAACVPADAGPGK